MVYTRTDVGGAGSTTTTAYLDQYVGNLEIKGRPWVDVRAHGAKGDNSTDDTAAIQAAINTISGTEFSGAADLRLVYFPPGRYKCTASLTRPSTVAAPGHNIVFFGAGPNASVLEFTSALGSGIGLSLGSTTATIQHVRIEDLGINLAGNASIGIQAMNFRYLKLSRVYVKGTGVAGTTSKGIVLAQDVAGSPFSGFLEMKDCHIEGHQRGLEADNVITASYVFGNKFTGAPAVSAARGISLLNTNVSGWHIIANEFEGFTEGGIYTKATQVAYIANRFESQTTYHIKFDAPNGTNVRSMTVANSYIGAVTNSIVTPSGNDAAAAGNDEGIMIFEKDFGLLGDSTAQLDARDVITDTLKVGSSASADVITNHFSETATLSFGTIGANTSSTQSMTVTGAAVGNTVVATPNGDVGSHLIWSARVDSINTVHVRCANPTTGSVVTTDRTWRADVWAH